LSTGDTPGWGSQGGVTGPGERTDTGIYDLQTHTFVPEPSSLVFAIIGTGLLLRRRRES
jgi:hypothetical protein